MDRREVIARIKSAEPALRARGVEALYLYGSYARDEARPDSDLDILIDFEPGRDSNLTRYLEPYHLLRECFPGTEIGFGTRDEIVPHYRDSIEHSAIRIF
jgi:predicted nucleotidyltransferase